MRMLLENPQLRVSRGAIHEDTTAMVQFPETPERFSVLLDKRNSGAQDFLKGDSAIPGHEASAHSVALCSPLVLDSQGPLDHAELGIHIAASVKAAHQSAIKRCNGNRVFNACAAIRSPKFEGGIFKR